jgi:DNA repair protein RadA/Sms
MRYICQQCGAQSPKYLGRCPNCGEWDTLIEQEERKLPGKLSGWLQSLGNPPRELAELTAEEAPRLVLPCGEFNRVLGGGIVPGSLVLVSGDPGIGKSTLLLQVSAMAAAEKGKVLYISGEESLHQIKLRAERLGIKVKDLYLLPETNLEVIFQRMEELSPRLGVIDSIQTVYLEELGAAPGSVGQIRECTLRLMRWAKSRGIPLLLTGHVTKEGTVAGPRVLEHIVDVVLYLEGELFSPYRILRGVKNRFGSINEVGVFEMREQGLIEVDNPSRAFLSQRRREAVGSAVVPMLEGSRPLLVEIQALTSATVYGVPRRTANGIDFNRLLLVTAVLGKRVGLPLSSQDIIVNVVGGLRISEPAADLGIALAITSSARNRSIDPELVATGEIGLSGELRAVPRLERRLAEAARLGFKRCLVPRASLPGLNAPREMELIAVDFLREALPAGLLQRQAESRKELPHEL